MKAHRRVGNYYTSQAIIDEFPQVKKANWGANVIGTFSSMGLVKGKYFSSLHRYMILIDSVAELIDFYDQCTGKFRDLYCRPNLTAGHHQALEYYTASELTEKYDIVTLAGWTYKKVGIVRRAGLLFGDYLPGEDRMGIVEQTFLWLMQYYDRIQATATYSHLDPDLPPVRFFDQHGNVISLDKGNQDPKKSA